MSPALKNGLLAGIVIVLAGVAVWRWRASTGVGELDDPNTITHWMCDKCGKHIDLTYKQYNEWLKSPDKLRHDPNHPGRQVVFWCPDCKEFRVVAAFVDKNTGKWLMPNDSNGQLTADMKAPPPDEGPAEKPAEKPAGEK